MHHIYHTHACIPSSSTPSRAALARADVAIIGGGPCGLATAHALAKVLPKSTITLFEKAPTLTLPRGAGLGLAVNGLKALKAIDPALLDAVVARSTTSRMMESRSIQGDVLKVYSYSSRYRGGSICWGCTHCDSGFRGQCSASRAAFSRYISTAHTVMGTVGSIQGDMVKVYTYSNS